MAKTTSTIKGLDIEPGQVFKLDGRWVRLVKWLDDGWQYNTRFALVAPAAIDPRMALCYDKLHRFRTHRFVFAGREYLTRDQPAVEYGWVTRLLEKESM